MDIVMRERKRKSKVLFQKEYGPKHGLRPGTRLWHWPIYFIFNEGGMGDFINWSASTKWVMDNSPWVHGTLFCPRYLVPLMKDVHTSVDWRVCASEDYMKVAEDGIGMNGPSIHIDGVNTTRQMLTALGAHLMDVGFAYFAGSSPPPKDLMLPKLSYGPDPRLKPGTYVVVTTGTGVSIDSRRVLGRHINPVIEHVVSLGLQPVFLGKSDLLNDGTKITEFPDDIRYDLGLDLRNQTNVKDAARIMQHAACTVGLDNGLLHLAAMMDGSKIVFGYNITTVEHREPRRNWGKHVNVYLTEDELICIACQSKVKQVGRHKFTDCFYRDTKCIDILFADNAKRFCDAIDEVIK